MKKCFSNIRTLAALLMAGAAFAACSSDDNSIEQSANPTAPKTYTLTINASKGDASTRALALNGTKLVAKWADGDELYVYKATNRAECTSDNKLGTISTVASAISADGDQATFTGTLSGTVTVSTDDKLMLVYHPAAFDITGFEGQDGTLASASALDCATALVTASVSGSDITIKETSATFTTHTAMLKLTLTTNGTTTINPTSLKMSMSLGSTTLKEFTFTPTDATYNANGNGVLYFALPSVEDVAAGLSTPPITITTTQLAGVTITYAATFGSDTYTATKTTGYKFAAGSYYAGTLTMTKPLTYPIALSAVTSAYVGSVVTADGNVYATVATASAASKTAVAVIAYVGTAGSVDASSASYKGLAIALSDANSGSGCQWADENENCLSSSQTNNFSTALGFKNGISCTGTLTGHSSHTHAAATAAASNNGTAAPMGTSGWFMPSMGQWNLIVQGLASKKAGSAITTDLTEGVENNTYKANNLNSVITDAGGTGLKTDSYWTSTEENISCAWVMHFWWGYGTWFAKSTNRYVRSVIAF